MRNKYILLLSCFIILILIFYVSYPGYLGPGDNTTYANIARNIVRGDGIAHNTVSIPDLVRNNGFPEKDLDQPIGWPIILVILI